MKIRIVLSCAVLWLVGGSILMAQPSAQFGKANQEYAASDFKAAIADYEELVRSGQDTPNVFYNLGNAYFRKSDFPLSLTQVAAQAVRPLRWRKSWAHRFKQLIHMSRS